MLFILFLEVKRSDQLVIQDLSLDLEY
jgi:hypothetical protein